MALRSGRTGAAKLNCLWMDSAAGPVVVHGDSAGETAKLRGRKLERKCASRSRSDRAWTIVRQLEFTGNRDAGDRERNLGSIRQGHSLRGTHGTGFLISEAEACRTDLGRVLDKINGEPIGGCGSAADITGHDHVTARKSEGTRTGATFDFSPNFLAILCELNHLL